MKPHKSALFLFVLAAAHPIVWAESNPSYGSVADYVPVAPNTAKDTGKITEEIKLPLKFPVNINTSVQELREQ